MQYIVILFVTYKDNTPAKKAIYDAETSELAVKSVYNYMGQYMALDNVKSVVVMASNSIGGIYKKESWFAPEETSQTETA